MVRYWMCRRCGVYNTRDKCKLCSNTREENEKLKDDSLVVPKFGRDEEELNLDIAEMDDWITIMEDEGSLEPDWGSDPDEEWMDDDHDWDEWDDDDE